jgi:DNA polymerase
LQRKRIYLGREDEKFSLDLETYSSRELVNCGVYAYAEAEEFEILLLGYAFNDGQVRIIDLKSGEKIPREVIAALTDQSIIKTAFNANFERTCLTAYFKVYMPPEQWRCTAVLALSLGLPSSLEAVSRCLKLPYNKLRL